MFVAVQMNHHLHPELVCTCMHGTYELIVLGKSSNAFEVSKKRSKTSWLCIYSRGLFLCHKKSKTGDKKGLCSYKNVQSMDDQCQRSKKKHTHVEISTQDLSHTE